MKNTPSTLPAILTIAFSLSPLHSSSITYLSDPQTTAPSTTYNDTFNTFSYDKTNRNEDLPLFPDNALPSPPTYNKKTTPKNVK